MKQLLTTLLLFLASTTLFAQSYDWFIEQDSSETFQSKVEEVMKLDSTDNKRNFFIAAYCYNRSLDFINNMDYKVSLDELKIKQEEIMQYLRFSKKHFLKMEDEEYRKIDQYIIKNWTYFGLNDLEQANYYKAKIKENNAMDRMKKEIEGIY